MQMRKLVILTIVFALGLAAYLWDQGRIEEQAKQVVADERVLPFDADQINWIEWELGGGQRLEKDDAGSWQLIFPRALPADPPEVKRLLRRLSKLNLKDAFIPETGKLKEFGLAPPFGKIQIGTQADATFTLLIGDVTPSDETRYFAIENEGQTQVFVLDAQATTELTMGVEQLRDHRVLAVKPYEAQTLDVELADGGSYQLEQRPGAWVLHDNDEGTTHATDLAVVGQLFQAVEKTVVRSYIDDLHEDTLSSCGLAIPDAILTFNPYPEVDDRPHRLLVGGTNSDGSQVYLMREDGDYIMKAPGILAAQLTPTALDLRQKAFFTIPLEAVDRVAIVARGETLQLDRDEDSRWRFSDEPEMELDQQKVVFRIQSMLDLQATHYLSERPDLTLSGLAQPNLEINIQSRARGLSQTLVTGRKAGTEDWVYARQLESDAFAGIDWHMPGKFFLSRMDFYETLMFKFNPDDAAKLRLELGEKALEFDRLGEGGWSARSEGSAGHVVLDAAVMNEWIKTFGYLRWEMRLNPNDPTDREKIELMQIEHPEKRMILYDTNGQEILSLGRGGESTRRVYVKRNDGQYFAIDRLNFHQLSTALEAALDAMGEQLRMQERQEVSQATE